MASAPAIVMMGVSGSGKTTVGEALAARLGVPFRDADEFHPQSNIEKMSAGIPLTDEDRWPWLDAIGARDPRHAGGQGDRRQLLGFEARLPRADPAGRRTPCHLRASRRAGRRCCRSG